MSRKLDKETKKIIKNCELDKTLDSGRIFSDNDAKKRINDFTRYRYSGYSAEIKVTRKKSYSIKKDLWKKVIENSQVDNLMPVLFVEIDGVQIVVLNLDDFLVMVEELSSRPK